MFYFATSSSQAAIAEMRAGRLGFTATPWGGTFVKDAMWIADNGCFSETFFDETRWWSWLQRHANAGDAPRCAFATAPDVYGNAAATAQRSAPWLHMIRRLGYPAAYVAQDGDIEPPWHAFDVLFIGGTTSYKLGPQARTLAAEARRRAKHVHMGRVSSLKRWRYAEAIGCHSADGTFLRFGPDRRLPELIGWIEDLDNRPALFRLVNE